MINVEIVKIMHIKSITVYCFILREYELLTWWEGRRDGAGIEREEGKGGIPPYSLNFNGTKTIPMYVEYVRDTNE